MKRALTMFAGIFFLVSFLAHGQELEENLSILKENTVTVKSKRTDYQQTFNHDPVNQHLITISIIETRKGEETVQSVNVMDLNPYLIKFAPQKDVVEITAGVNSGKDLVKVIEDGEIQNYDDELVFYASGIEEARKLTDALKAVVENASENLDKLLPVSDDKQSLLDIISEGIKEVNINDDVYDQSFNYDNQNNNIVTFVISNASGDKVEEYTLNVADLNMHKVDFTTKQKEVLIPLPTKGDKKLIAYTENGETGNFINELELRAHSIEEARLLEAQFEALIAIAEKEETVDYSVYTADQCAAILTEKISEVVINQDAYQQEIRLNPENGSILIYTLQDISKGDRYEYTVNAADFGKTPVSFNTSRNAVFIELKISGDRDLIKEVENNEDVNYESEIEIRVPDIETARAVSGAFTRFNQLALEKMEGMTAFANATEAEKYLLEEVEQVVIETDTYLQSIEKNSECLMKYNMTDVSKDTRYEYEFNLKDVDPYKIQFNTKGSEAFVILEIKGGNDLIKTIENGEVDKYSAGLQVKAKDVEQARKLETALKMMTDVCSVN